MAVPPKHLAVAGSLNADLVFSLHRVPKAGETLAARSLTVHPGGKVGACCQRRRRPARPPLASNTHKRCCWLQGGNQAAAAARLGCATKLVAQVGRDAQATM